MAICYLIVGGNMGNRMELIQSAGDQLNKKVGKLIRKSLVYESEPWGFQDNIPFLNQVRIHETRLLPENLLEIIRSIEENLGRKRHESSRYEARTMDIDILFYDNDQVQANDLCVPHPRLHLRKFVLLPLMEIAPEMIHPVLNKTIWELFRECQDPGWVKSYMNQTTD